MPAQLIQWTDATLDRMIDFIKADDLTRRTLYKREDEGMSGITKSEAWLHIARAIVDASQREEIEQNQLYGRKCAKAVGNKLRSLRRAYMEVRALLGDGLSEFANDSTLREGSRLATAWQANKHTCPKFFALRVVFEPPTQAANHVATSVGSGCPSLACLDETDSDLELYESDLPSNSNKRKRDPLVEIADRLTGAYERALKRVDVVKEKNQQLRLKKLEFDARMADKMLKLKAEAVKLEREKLRINFENRRAHTHSAPGTSSDAAMVSSTTGPSGFTNIDAS